MRWPPRLALAPASPTARCTGGQIGEYMTASASGVALINNVASNIVSLDLAAGDWDVSGNCQFSRLAAP